MLGGERYDLIRRIFRMSVDARGALAIVGVVGVGLGLSASGSALAVTPSPPPGAPAVESAPPSLVGFNPQLPASVISASAARGSRWTPEKPIYGTASINDIKLRGANG